jgi:uncharacterized protein YmfQ (DUF2313 family)
MFQQPRTSDEVLTELLEVTPSGWALPDLRGTNWASWLTPISAEWSLIEQTDAAMLQEISPLSAVYMLPDYQRVLGADPYGRDAASLQLSPGQEALLAFQRWTEFGNMAVSDYVALAAASGVTITIQQFWPTIAGLAHCGDLLCSDLPLAVGNAACGDTLGYKQIVFYLLVSLPSYFADPALAGMAECGDFLGNAGSDPVAAAISGEAPSHTLPVFAYH